MAHFTHDCNACVFLGSIELEHRVTPTEFAVADVYVCGEQSIIIRTGSDGPDYASFPMETAERMAASYPEGQWALALGLYAEAKENIS